MRVKSYLKFLRYAVIIILASCFSVSASASDKSAASKAADNLTEMQKEARSYRENGLAAQRTGDYDSALNLYQKAVALDPNYAVPYNDMGIIYESKGDIDKAQESYFHAVKIDPFYESAYTNLALIYESKRDLVNAAACWQKRTELGSLDDPWTQKAFARLRDIRMSMSDGTVQDTNEQRVLDMMKDMAVYKEELGKDDKLLAKDHFTKAKRSYKEGDFATAMKEALDAQYFDADNKEIEQFIEKTQIRALSR
jgi:tetratricopeptide (TPR) repeat protein